VQVTAVLRRASQFNLLFNFFTDATSYFFATILRSWIAVKYPLLDFR
jgi:hypothetical protein